ncbi:MAG: hypothetical protein CSYNP_04046 [Syntrophus sp. SKADARSKE-3]|nr:hypothetical protein [Syntrophus sp. SKADARSKE-3]
MRSMKSKTIFLSMILFLFCATAAGAAEVVTPAEGTKKIEQKTEEAKPTTEVKVSVLSAYIAKGDELSRNSIVIQPQIMLGYKGLSLAIWGNLDTQPYLADRSTYKGDKRHNWTETDVTLAYNRSFGIVNAGVAYAYFGNAGFWNSDNTSAVPDQKDDQEVSMSLRLNTILSPNLKVARSFDATQIWYMMLGLSHTFELNKAVELTISASGSYLISEDDNRLKINSNGTDRKAYGAKNDRYNNFHDAVVSLNLSIKPTSYLTITPQVSYVFPMCDDAKYDMQSRSMQWDTTFSDRQYAYLVGGVSVALSF